MRKCVPSVNWGRTLCRGTILVVSLFIILVIFSTNVTPIEKSHFSLLALAEEEPDSLIEVIIQRSNNNQLADDLVLELGGEIIKDLAIINAFSARLPAKAVPELTQSSAVNWLSLDAPVTKVSGAGSANLNTIRADFNGADFIDGNIGNWAEVGEADGPDLGDVVITNFLGGAFQGIRIQGQGTGIQGELDLTQAESAVLSLAYRRKGFEAASDNITIELSSDDGENWAEIGRITGPAADSNIVFDSYDLTPFVTNNNLLRLNSSAEFQSGGRFYIDYIQVEYLVAPLDLSLMPYKSMLPFITSPETETGLDELSGTFLAAPANTVRDEFNTAYFNNNDGTITWSTNWIETGDDGTPSGPNITIETDEEACPIANSKCLEIDADLLDDSIERGVDLSLASSATLRFDYRIDEDGAAFVIEATSNDGANWTNLSTYTVATTVLGETIDLSSYLSANTRIRFRVVDTDDEANLNIDNIEISYATSGGLVTSGISNTVLDEFSQTSWGNNDGTMDWSGSWTGYDYGGDGPDVGYVYIEDGRFTFHYAYAYEEYAVRSADLSGSTQATLSFDWQTLGLDSGETISVLVSKDGQTFTQLAVYGGSQSGLANIDITEFIAANTTIRFENRSTHWEYGEYAYFDNVQISHGCVECIDTSNLNSTYVKAIKADQLWNQSPYLQGQDISVAVVDSGISNHDDLRNAGGNSRVIAQAQFMTVDTLPDDLYGHGTHVAGTIGGNGTKSNGEYIGVAPKVNLVDVKVIDDHGVGYTSDVVAGLEWILKHKDRYNIRVVNLSLNSAVKESYHNSPLDAALEILWFNGLVVVVSAGNNGNDGILYAPANDPFFITVGATDDLGTNPTGDDLLTSFSAHGETENGFLKPDILAPGTDIISLLASDDSNLALEHPTHTISGPNGNYYFRMSGTSMSSAVVSGAAALLLQDEPDLNPDQVKYRLLASGSPFKTPTPGPTLVTYLDVAAAVNGTSTAAANTNITASQLLWSGDDPVSWGSVNWGSVNWGSVNWGSVNWGSVNWGSVNWGSVNWGS